MLAATPKSIRASQCEHIKEDLEILDGCYGVSTYAWSIMKMFNNDMNTNFIYFILIVTLVTLSVGFWWFLSGTGEKRLEKVFEQHG